MNVFSKTLKITIATAIAIVSVTAMPAFATKNDRIRFETCKELRANGQLNWHGIATGTIADQHVGRGSSRSFHAKACFTTQSACQTWVKRIWWEIPQMDELRVAYCKPV